MTDRINIEQYHRFVDGLWQAKRGGIEGLLHAGLGIAGEAGEVVDHIKKAWAFGKELDTFKVDNEAGDLLHYLTAYCNERGITLGDLAQLNFEKLSKRYPNGFSFADAIAQQDKIT